MLLGLTTWQWLIVATMLAGSIVVAFALRAIIASLIRRLLRRAYDHVPHPTLVTSVARSIALMIVAQLDGVALEYLELSKKATQRLDVILDTAAIVFVTIAVYQFIELICSRVVAHVMRHREHGRDIATTIAPLVASTLKFLVAVLGISAALGALGVNIAAIIAGLSIGGAAIALASQDTVKNIFGSIVILSERPFVVGDWITTQGIEGVVEEIGFRSTRIRTFADSVVFLSNAKLADSMIENMDMRNVRRFKTSVNVDIATSPEMLQKLINDIRGVISSDASTVASGKKIFVNVSAITEHGVAITVVSWFKVDNANAEPEVLHRLNMGILTAMQAHGALIRGDYAPVSDHQGTAA
jgi:MscS family membrane protein